jgi:superfamily II DNA or RNA helicase
MLKEIVIIKKINESFLEIECEKHVANELWEEFTFFAENYKFDPRFRNRQWDGKIHLFALKSRTIYVGLLDEVISFLKKNGYQVELDESVLEKSTLDYSIIDKIKKNFLNKKFDLRDYQIELFEHACNTNRSICISPTGSGKALMIYLVTLFYLLNKKTKILIIVPRTSLILQLEEEFKMYAEGTKLNIEQYIHKIYSGQNKDSNKLIYISTWQSIGDMPKEWYQQFSVCISDEAHTSKAKVLREIMDSCTEAKYRHGFTGTPTNDGENSFVNIKVLKGVFGEPTQKVKTKELIEKNVLSDIKINALRFRYQDKEDYQFIKNLYENNTPSKSFQSEQDYVIGKDFRNNFIAKLALSLDKNTIVFFQFVDKQGKVLYDIIDKLAKEYGKEVYLIHGNIKVAERERIRKLVEEKNNIILISSFGTTSTGVNFKNVHNAIFASAFKASIIIRQTLGRGLRVHENKTVFTVYDIGDDFSRNTGLRNFLFRHFIERLKIYKKENLTYTVYDYDIKNNKIIKG